MTLADRLDFRIIADAQWAITWMFGFLVRIIVSGVVATDKCPSWPITSILIRPMESVCMKKNCRPRFQLAIDQWQARKYLSDTLRIRSGLVPDLHMVNPAQSL